MVTPTIQPNAPSNTLVATILVLYNAGPVDVSWAVSSEKVIAIIESFFPGQVNRFFIVIKRVLKFPTYLLSLRLVVMLLWMC